MRESEIEKSVGDYAKRRGWAHYKWQSTSHRGVPDRLFFRRGALILVEFKAPGCKPTELQRKAHARLGAEGFPVFVIDSKAQGRALFDLLETPTEPVEDAWFRLDWVNAADRSQDSRVVETAEAALGEFRKLASPDIIVSLRVETLAL